MNEQDWGTCVKQDFLVEGLGIFGFYLIPFLIFRFLAPKTQTTPNAVSLLTFPCSKPSSPIVTCTAEYIHSMAS